MSAVKRKVFLSPLWLLYNLSIIIPTMPIYSKSTKSWQVQGFWDTISASDGLLSLERKTSQGSQKERRHRFYLYVSLEMEIQRIRSAGIGRRGEFPGAWAIEKGPRKSKGFDGSGRRWLFRRVRESHQTEGMVWAQVWRWYCAHGFRTTSGPGGLVICQRVI